MANKKRPKVEGDTATRILEAADALVGETGFDAVSVRDVAVRAGVNKALVFYHFQSRAHLFERVLERYYTAHLEALRSALKGGGEPVARLRRMIDAYFDFLIENRRYPRLVQALVAANSDQRALVEKTLAPLFDWTVQALSEVTPREGPLAARQFYVTFSGMMINYFTYAPVLGRVWGADPLSAEALAERRAHVHWIADTLLAGLGKAPTPSARPAPARRA